MAQFGMARVPAEESPSAEDLAREVQRLRRLMAAHLEVCPASGGLRAPMADHPQASSARRRHTGAIVRRARSNLGALISDLVDF